MNKSEIKSFSFDQLGINTLGSDTQEFNWPVVYQIYDDESVYVGETTNLKARMVQHLQNPEKSSLNKFSAVFDSTYNKSAALDLESQLIQWFGGEGVYKMLNKNHGMVNRDYYKRSEYQNQFPAIWEKLHELQLAHKSIKEIENSGLFKFSPYKNLNFDQIKVVNEVLFDLEESILKNQKSISVIGGSEGTGKTIVLMFLIKLIRDIQDYVTTDDDLKITEQEFGIFFKSPFNERFKEKKLAMVVPSQALKGSIAKVFKVIQNLNSNIDLLSPIEFGSSEKNYDITFVDEAHLLKISNQEVHKSNREKVNAINEKLFNDDKPHTELDWIIEQSKHVVMVYGDQRIRPNNISSLDLKKYNFREHILKSQIRSKGGELYIDYLRSILSSKPPATMQTFNNFDFELYNDFKQFVDAIKNKEQEHGLCRIVSGYAWEWKSKLKASSNLDDVIIDGIGFKWNSTLVDWIGSPNSVNEIGSIYTIQGYDLNYCGVIIGNDLKYDVNRQKITFDRKNNFDRGAKKRNKLQIEANIALSDEELLDQIVRTYRILMNRSIKGTYVYVCDNNLRDYLSKYIPLVYK